MHMMTEISDFLECFNQVGRHASKALVMLQNHAGTTDAQGFIASTNFCWHFGESNLLKMTYLGTKVASIARTECIYVI